MQKFKNLQDAYASQQFNPDDVQMSGVPAHIVEAAKAFINLCVVHDAVNPTFVPDFTKSDRKYCNYFNMGSPSGSRFSFDDNDAWGSCSVVGSRLVSESSEAATHIAKIAKAEYKKMMVYKREIKK